MTLHNAFIVGATKLGLEAGQLGRKLHMCRVGIFLAFKGTFHRGPGGRRAQNPGVSVLADSRKNKQGKIMGSVNGEHSDTLSVPAEVQTCDGCGVGSATLCF